MEGIHCARVRPVVVRVAAVLVCFALGGTVSRAWTASASAAVAGTFGTEGEGAGQLNQGLGIAIDNGNPLTAASAGDAYVADAGNNRIDKFAGDGEFLLAWGWGVADGKAEAQVCGPQASPPSNQCQAGTEGAGAGQMQFPAGAAVDSSPSPSHGDVYVEDGRNDRVEKFSEDGQFLLAWGWGVADGKEELETCGPQAVPATSTCLAGLEGSGSGQFEGLQSGTIAVNSIGSVLVGTGSRVEEFGEGGALEAQVALSGEGNEVDELAVDAAGDLYAVRSEFGVPLGLHEYDGAGAEVAALDPSADFETVLALGPSGELFVDDSGRIAEYRAGAQVASMPSPVAPTGMAFGDRTSELYLLGATEVDTIVLPPPGPLIESASATPEPVGTATVRASIDPEGAQTSYQLEYGVEPASETATPPATMAAEGFEPETVEIKLTGLDPKTVYHFHLIATNSAGTTESEDHTFQTLPPVSIDGESASQVSTDSARLRTTLNPLGLQTEYRFEYGTSAAYGTSVPVPDASAGAGLGDVSFDALVEGLVPDTTYHYRVVARNSFGEETGADRVFTTRPATTSAATIDGRGWELVSPPDKHGAPLEAIATEGGAIQAAAAGGALAYIARDPVSGEPAGNRSFAEQQLLAARGPGGWSTTEIATQHEAVAGLFGGQLSEYRQFSPDLAAAALEPAGSTPLSPAASERTPYLREDDGEYVPLATGCPAPGEACAASVAEHADVPPGTKFGAREEGGRLEPSTGVQLRLASPDLAHVLISAPQSLVAGFETGGQQAIYEWSAGALQPVSVLPGGASAISESGDSVGYRDQLVRNAVSADGQRVYFESAGHLYFRDLPHERSVQLDAPEAGLRLTNGAPGFQYATPDGLKALFTDEARLTADANTKPGEPNLYLCEPGASGDEQPCAAKGRLTDLTVGYGGEPADVLGAAIGASEDASYVYFVANGVLANGGTAVPGAVQGDCGKVETGASCNLYEWHDGTLGLVAVLSGNDFPDWEAGSSHTDLSQLTARVSPDGRYLAFMSERPLTGYDNHDVASGQADEEVFLYDASSGRTVCASCDPSGGRPSGALEPRSGSEPTSLVDRVGAWSGHWVAASIPGWTPIEAGTALYQSRYLSNEGRLFFDTPDSLVAGDANGTQDVYEFEPRGVGGCESGLSSRSAVFVPEVAASPVEGCLGLISSGTSSEESVFLDASARGPGGGEGEDAFFLTAARLSGSDIDNALDVYDAHVCSAGLPCPAPAATTAPACTTADSCRAASPPPPAVFGAPASATLAGTGNPAFPKKATPRSLTRAQRLARSLKACRKKPRRRRRRCEENARRLYGSAKRSRSSRRVHRSNSHGGGK